MKSNIECSLAARPPMAATLSRTCLNAFSKREENPQLLRNDGMAFTP